ncbi:uncharacterized protein PG998_014449 [Apiospora kogelbergensis]|uniref:uncharacterized protein n=1 Tax=Apiospora kogelbergensis TaxID=1337665 RepID=UPI0031314569
MMDLAVIGGGSKSHKNHQHHHLTMPGLLFGISRAKEPGLDSYASLDWKIESPPAILYGDAENSTGALVSGQLLLTVKKVSLVVESLRGWLHIHVSHKRPYRHRCPDCSNQKTELENWTVLANPITLNQGLHEYPFSVLLDGHLPATTNSSIVAVKYEFTFEVKLKHRSSLNLSKTIDVKRALPAPELPHHSVRVFPPTSMAVSVHYPQVIHTNESNKLHLRVEGFVKTDAEMKSVEYWTLKRLSWKLEEHLSTIAPACAKHSSYMQKVYSEETTMKGVKRTESRTIGSAELSSGWKSDYSCNGGVEMDLEYQCNNARAEPICDMKAHDGTEVTHQLIVQLVVVQEYASSSQPKQIIPTGVARILRMHLGITLTERAGLGVSWDNEAPPPIRTYLQVLLYTNRPRI